jgi:hypothetical protein
VAGSERVYAGFAIHDVDLRRGHAGSDCHFFNDVQQLAFVGVGGIRVNEAAIQQFSDRASSARERERLEKAARRNHPKRAGRGGEKHFGVRPGRGRRRFIDSIL